LKKRFWATTGNTAIASMEKIPSDAREHASLKLNIFNKNIIIFYLFVHFDRFQFSAVKHFKWTWRSNGSKRWLKYFRYDFKIVRHFLQLFGVWNICEELLLFLR